MVIMQNNDNCNDRGNGAKQCDGKSRIRLFLNLVQYGVVIVVLVMFFITNKIDFTSFLCSSSCSSSSSFLLVPTAVSLPPASRASILSSQAVEVSLSLSSWFFGRAGRVSRASILSSQAVEVSLRLSLSLSAWFFRRAERPASILSSHEVEVSIWWWSRLISTYLKIIWVMIIFLTLFIFINIVYFHQSFCGCWCKIIYFFTSYLFWLLVPQCSQWRRVVYQKRPVLRS